MNLKRVTLPPFRALGAVLLVAVTVAGCRTTRPVEDPARQLREEIAPALGLEFEGDLVQGKEKNFVGVSSEDLLLTRRGDSLTYFVQDKEFGVTRAGGVFAGSDDELLGRSREIAGRLGVPAAEIDQASVMQVMNTVASVDVSGAISTEEPQRGERYARLTRAMEGMPVFSSGVMLALDRSGEIGFLELHWPEISTTIVDRARAMGEKIESGWEPPEVAQAYVESVEAGILHSPAIAFVMDVQPVIRVIYTPADREVGKKPVLYLDLDGKPVSMPRQFERVDVPAEGDRTGEVEG